jgi:hypothetical protein
MSASKSSELDSEPHVRRWRGLTASSKYIYDLHVQADGMRRWQVAARRVVANGWGAGLGRPGGEGTWRCCCLLGRGRGKNGLTG